MRGKKRSVISVGSRTQYLRSVVKTFQAGGFNPLDVRHHCMQAGLSERRATLFAVRLSRMPGREPVVQAAMQG